MPELDGIAALDRLKSDSALQHVPVIMISALDEHCLRRGLRRPRQAVRDQPMDDRVAVRPVVMMPGLE